MHSWKPRSIYRRLALLILVCMAITPVPSGSLAQQPNPPDAPSTPTTTKPAAEGTLISEPGQYRPEAKPAAAAQAKPSHVLLQPDGALKTVEGTTPAPTSSPPLIDGVQSSATLDVSTPDTLRASELLTYTYSYTNTTTGPITLTIRAVWSFFVYGQRREQFCTASPDPAAECKVIPGSVVGPAVQKLQSCPETLNNNGPDKLCYTVGTLSPGQKGRFSVRLGSLWELYPKTNVDILRLSGSAQLFIGSSTAVTGEDTSSSLLVGPVLNLSKTVENPGTPIYPTFGETDHPNDRAVFTIKLGNATGERDIVDGNIRADARRATNIILKDFIPAGAKFVSAEGNPTVVDTSSERSVTWVIPGPLNPGETIQRKVTYRRENTTTQPCDVVDNRTYFATSDEYPLAGEGKAGVGGPGVGIGVIQPMWYHNFGLEEPVVYGQSGSFRITLKSFWDQPITGAQLRYSIQSNATYVTGSATANVPHTVAAADNVVTWTFNMPAASKTDPAFATFEISFVGGYTDFVDPSTGRMQLTLPANVPGKCIPSEGVGFPLDARLELSKDAFTQVPPEQIDGDIYLVRNGQEFEFVITVVNKGVTAAEGLTIYDDIPSINGADFSYVTGSSTAGEPVQSVSPDDPEQKQLRWENKSVPAGGQLSIRYKLKVKGKDFIIYNNVGFAKFQASDERLDYDGNFVRLQIRPLVSVTKKINNKQLELVQPGAVVTFTMTLSNDESTPYEATFFDCFNDGFTYLSTVEPNLQPTNWQFDERCKVWPMQTLEPGSDLTVNVRAKVPEDCLSRDYRNEALFRNTQDVYVRMIPAAEVFARVNCGQVEYRKDVDRGIVSLKDKIVYTIRLRNGDGNAANNVVVEDLLPTGFSYVRMSANSVIKTDPTKQQLSDGRTKMTWTVPTIAANSEVFIVYEALTGEVVGEHANLVKVVAGGQCIGDCITVPDETGLYSRSRVTVSPLITLEPSVSPPDCARPNDKRTYKVSVVNTNVHSYENTVITTSLPLGLEFVRVIREDDDDTPDPRVLNNSDGTTTILWENLVIPQRGSATFFQKDFVIEIQVGDVGGNLRTQVQASSKDGAIPRKDGVSDPTIVMCVQRPTISKNAAVQFVEAGEEFTYQITLSNPKEQILSSTVVTDALPLGLTYVGVEDDAPEPTVTNDGRLLSWTANVPVGSTTTPSVVTFKIRVRVASEATVGTKYTNTAFVTWPSGVEGNRQSSATVAIPTYLYLPMTSK